MDQEFSACPQVHFLQGTLGLLKYVDPNTQLAAYGSGILLNQNTVLTLSQYVFNKYTSSYHNSLQFCLESNQSKTYRISEAFVLKQCTSTKNIRQSEIQEYVALKLERNLTNAETFLSLLHRQKKHQAEVYVQQNNKSSDHEEQLRSSNLLIEELSNKLNEARKQLSQTSERFCSIASYYCQGDTNYNITSDIVQQCVAIEQYLHGEDCLETIILYDLFAKISSQASDKYQMVQYYLMIVEILQRHGQEDDNDYADYIFRIGSAYFQCKSDKDIAYLELALHLYEDKSAQDQQQCARLLASALERKGLGVAAMKIREKYEF